MSALIISTSYAEEIFPTDCKPFTLTQSKIQLPSKKAKIIMMHNFSTTNVWIIHPTPGKSASAGWSSRLDAENWSALYLTGKKFALTCIESKPGHEQEVACQDVLAFCQWIATKTPDNTANAYWAAENKSLSEIIAYLGRRGFEWEKPNNKKKEA